ncbi:MAG: 3-keto-5-aminohexanoate cleavage protein [Desulfofustis sp.]|nr:3-keto-5-aminohexanoate cleavage protein [Desulfofustis sp.]
METPILIASAPNGARRTKADHPRLPITAGELVETAVACAEAGAGMMHFHIRDPHQRHSLDPEQYRRTLTELEAAVGDRMLLQVTSEAAGIYSQPEQIELMKRFAPHCISCGLREFIRDEGDLESASAFFSGLHDAGTLIQYILYTPEEAGWFSKLCQQGAIPGSRHFLLFVFGRYTEQLAVLPHIDDFLRQLEHHRLPFSWMVCGFNLQEFEQAEAAAVRGGHIRVGFENNCLNPDGNLTGDNSEQVRIMVSLAERHRRHPAGKDFAEGLYG